jgi:fibronectin-binding autotransporter adhesin
MKTCCDEKNSRFSTACYTGPTTISNGTLLVTGLLATTTNLITVAGGSLGGTGTIGGPTTVNSGGTLTVGGSTGTTMGTLAFGTNLSLAGNTILRLKKGGSPASDSITSGGALAFGGTLTLSSVGSTLAANDSFPIFSAGGTGVFASFSPATPGTGLVWDTSSLNSSGIIKVAALAATITAPVVFPAAVTNTYGTASSPTSVAVSGANLTGNITANAPAGFEVSSDNISYGSTATYVQSGGSASGTLYLRIAATSLVSGSYNSKNVVLTSSGAGTANVATTASGNAVFPKALTVASASVSNKLFDGTTNATIASTLQTAEGIGSGTSSDGKPYTGDTLTLSGTGTFPTSAAGGPYTVTPSTFTLGGSSATNYSLTQPTGLSLSASILNTAVWTQSAGGSWTNNANWLNNLKGTGADNTADFSTLSLTASTIVTLDGTNTIGNLRFDDQSGNSNAWTLNTGSKGPLTLAVSSGSPVISNNVTTTIGAVIAGTNGLTATGFGTLILLNTNTYSGGTEISAGTVQLDTGVTNIATAGTGPVQIDANGILSLNYGADATIAYNLTGTGTIVENGLTTGGAVVLTGTNSFSGQVKINVNKVAFSSSTSGNGAPKIAIGLGGTMSLGSGYAGGTLTISELSGSGEVDPKYGTTPSGNRTLNINQSSTTTYSGIMVDGTSSRYLAITKSGTGTLIISGSGNAYSGPTTVSNGTLEVDGTIGYGPTLTYGSVAVNGGTLDGSGTIYGPVTLNSGTLAPATASGIGTLNINNTLTITGGTVAMRISKTGGSTTSDNLAGPTSVTYGGTLTVTNVTSDGHLLAAGDTFTLFGGSSYSGGFSTNNLPTLPAGLSWDLSGLTVSGSIAVTANTAPVVFNPTSGGYVGALPVTMTSESGATIHYTTDGSDPTTSGTVISAASPASVTVPVNTPAETIKAYATKSGKGNAPVNSAIYSTVATPTWINPSSDSWSGNYNWSNSVVANGIGVTADFSKLTLPADNTVTLDTAATVGGLTFGDQGNAHNWILAAAGNPLTLNAGTNTPIINIVNQTTTIGSVITGSSGLIKSGTGTLTLTGNNTYSGGTEISAGTVQIANGTGSTATAGSDAIQVDTNGSLIFNYGATASFNNNLTGTGTIIQNGPGEVTLNGNDSFSGLIQINNTNLDFYGSNSGSGQPRIAISSNGTLKLGLGFVGGTLTISELSGSGTVNEGINTTSGTRTLCVNQASTTTFSGVLSDSTLSRYLAVIKSGTGTLVLSGPNAYTGATTVSNGTLEVDGQIANSPVAVKGGTLNGSGTISGSVTLNNGTLAPATASGIGTLTINNTLTLSGGTVAMRISKNGGSTTSDKFAGLTSVTYGSTLAVTNITSDGHLLAAGDTFTLFSAGSYSGNVAATNLPPLPTGLKWNWNAAAGTLAVVNGVNTNPTNITATVSGNLLTLAWPADRTGWRLLEQTNNLAAGISANTNDWMTVPGSTTIHSTNITINPALPSEFYRLVYP